MTQPTLLHQILDSAAAAAPSAPAVSGVNGTMTYAELRSASLRMAGHLRDLGLRRGDRMLVEGRADHRTAGLLYAASRLGVIFAVVHHGLRGPAQEHIAADCAPSIVVSSTPSWRDVAERFGILQVALAELGAEGCDITALPAEPSTIDPAALIYTSGTTSMPLAVVSTHQQMLFAASAIQSIVDYHSDDVVFMALPLAFDYGLYQLFIAALGGAQVRFADAGEVGPGLVNAMQRCHASVLPSVPSLAADFATLLSRRPARPHYLRLLTTTGAAMPAGLLRDLRRLLPNIHIHTMYGLTECKRVSIMPADGDIARPDSCGLPLPGTQVLVVDGRGRPVPPGAVGEFVVRGPHVMSGYWRQPEATASRFMPDDETCRRLRTGDYGWVDDDGYLYFAGRHDDIYKSAGFRVSAVEVEAAARRVVGVTAAALIVPTSAHPEPLLVVTSTLPAASVLAAMRSELEDPKIPARCLVVPRLPLSANHKIDKKALADAYL